MYNIDYPFSLAIFFLKTLPCLTMWPPIISWRFLLRLNAIIGVAWNSLSILVFICKIFQFLFTILDELGSVLKYVIDSGILFLLFFSLLANSSFLSILSTYLICSSRTYSFYCWSGDFCLVIANFLSNSVVVEQIFFSLKAWLYGMLSFRDLGCSDLGRKNACWSVGLWYKVVWMFYFRLYIILRQEMQFHLGEIGKSNFVVLCFSFSSFMNVINSAFVSSIFIRYSRDIPLMYG